MDGRVRIGNCHGAGEVALVRAMMEAHEIPVLISGEHHSNMMGGLMGSAVSLDIWVGADDVDEARELLRDLRASTPEQPDADDDPDADPDPDADDDDVEEVPVEARIDCRKRTGVALLLSCCVTFGTGHLYTRAWIRGLALAGLELYAFTQLGHAPTLAAMLLGLAIGTDAVGSVLRARAMALPATLPAAKVVKRS